MTRLDLSGLRARLLLLVLLAVIPVSGLMLYTAAQQRRHAAAKAQEGALQLVQLVSTQQEELIAAARQQLVFLARLPEVRGGDAAACRALFAGLLKRYPTYTNLAVADSHGDVVCSAISLRHPANVANRVWFQDAAQTGSFGVGDPEIDELSGKAEVDIANSLLDATGQVRALVYVGLSLAWFNEFAANAGLSPGSVLVAVDRRGTVLARYPNPDQQVGESMPDAPAVKAMLRQREGVAEATDTDGATRLYAFAPLGRGNAYVGIGIPTTAAFAEANRVLAQNLIVLALVAGLALVACWVAAGRFILRPVDILVATTGRLAAGDLSARTGQPHKGGELSQLARAFDQMAESLEQREAERKRAEEQYGTILRTALDGFWLVDTEGRLLDVNDAYCRLTGYSRDELLRMRVQDVEAIETSEETARHIQRVREIGSDRFETRQRGKDGSIVDIEVSVNYLKGDDGRLVVFLRDITEHKRAGEALRDSEARFRSVAQSANDAIISADGSGNVVFWNQGAEAMFGYAEEEVLGKPLTLLMPDRYRDAHCRGLERLRSTGESRIIGKAVELHGLRKGRNELPVELSIATWKTAKETFYTAIVRDISERERSQQALREAESKYRSLVEQALAGVAIIQDDRLVYANPRMAEIYGYAAQELLALPSALDLVAEVDRGLAAESMANSIEGKTESIRQTFHGRRKDGKTIEIEVHGTRGEYAGKPAIIGFVLDITERRQLEAQLLQAQKMEAVGRLAGGIAHDFNNLLTAIMGYSDLLLDQLGDDNPLKPDLEEIKKAGGRAAALTRQLLAFSRKQPLQPQVVDLNSVVRDLEAMLRRVIVEDISLATVTAPDLASVRADPGQIEQVLMNLAINARDAMPQGGTLAIETANVTLDEVFAHGHPGARPGRHVMLAVSDNGCGMDAEVQAHLFEPFFTTKETGKGTGLGLSTVYGIVKQSGGYIDVKSEPGHGTTFKIYLPQVDEPAGPLAPGAAGAGVLKGSETVLLVEDEPGIRELVRKILERQGYTVLEARDASEALLASARHTGPIDLLLTDVVMPGLSGPELAQRLTHVRPKIKVLFVSGYAVQAATHLGWLSSRVAILQKPFTPDALARRVREVLDAPRSRSATGPADLTPGGAAPTS